MLKKCWTSESAMGWTGAAFVVAPLALFICAPGLLMEPVAQVAAFGCLVLMVAFVGRSFVLQRRLK